MRQTSWSETRSAAARSRGTSRRRSSRATSGACCGRGGAYLLNVIDRGGLSLVRAEAATLLEVFANVMMVARDGPAPGNLVLFASDAPLPRFEPRDARLYDRAFVERFAAAPTP